MKRIFTFLASLMLGGAMLSAQPLLNEGFDTGIPSGWTQINDANTLANQPSEWGFSSTQAWTWFDGTDESHNLVGNPGGVIASTSFFSPTGTADRWIITPALTLPSDASAYAFSFDVAAQDVNYPDGFYVAISTTTATATAFTPVLTVPAASTEWTNYVVSLAAYAGQTIYIALVNNSNDMFVLKADNFFVGDLSSIEYTISASVYPTYAGSVTGTTTTAHVGDTVTLTAVSSDEDHYTFNRWNDGVTTNPRQVIVSGSADYVAIFDINVDPTTYFSEDFEEGIPISWVMYNDANTPYYEDFDDAWTLAEGAGNPGNAIWSTSYFAPSANADRWVCTDGLIVEDTTFVFRMDAMAQDESYPDGFQVKVSTTDRAKANFTTTILDVPAAPTTWTAYTTSLSQFVGDTVYFAIVNNSNDMFILLVDNVMAGGQDDMVFSIAAESYPTGIATFTGTGDNYHLGDTVILTATSTNPAYNFVSWNDGNTSNPRTIIVNGNALFVASFATNAQVNGVASNITGSSADIAFTKNSACSFYKVGMDDGTWGIYMGLFGYTLADCLDEFGVTVYSDTTISLSGLEMATTYTLYTMAYADINDPGNSGTVTFTTIVEGGGTGTATLDVTISNVTATSANLSVIMGDQTAYYYFIFGTTAAFEYNGLNDESSVLEYCLSSASHYSTNFNNETLNLSDAEPNSEFQVWGFPYNQNVELGTVNHQTFFNSVGIDDVETLSLELYPNPAVEMLNIRSNGNIDRVELINSLGQVVFVGEAMGNSAQINVTNIAKGTYIMRLTSNGNVATHKVIVK